MAKNVVPKVSIDEEVKTLKKHFGGIIATVKALKETVERLEKKMSKDENNEIKDIMETQRVIEEVIVANGDAIKRIDREIKKISKEASKDISDPKESRKTQPDAVQNRASEKDIVNADDLLVSRKKLKRCRYNNRGYCKYKNKCRFTHVNEVCHDYLKHKKCDKKECEGRHPKACKWDQQSGCRRGVDCQYLHGAFSEPLEFNCAGCKDTWNQRNCVKAHTIQNMEVFFCLNCDDWIKDKAAVFIEGWKMFDDQGFLRYDL